MLPKTEVGAHHGFTTGVEFGVKGKCRRTPVGKVHVDKAGELAVERHKNGVELFLASFSALRNLESGGLNASPVHFHKRLDLIGDLLRGDALVFLGFPNFCLQKPTLVSDQNTDGNQGDGQKRNQKLVSVGADGHILWQ